MWSLLGQILVFLVAALVLGFAIGLLLGRANAAAEGADDADERDAREGALQEELDRAKRDLEAHAVELADANEEITCLLEALHEARRPGSGRRTGS